LTSHDKYISYVEINRGKRADVLSRYAVCICGVDDALQDRNGWRQLLKNKLSYEQPWEAETQTAAAAQKVVLHEETPVSSGIDTLSTEVSPSVSLPVVPATDAADELPLTVIERKPGWRFIDVGELWRFRELLFFLVWRDIKVRYKQTVLGAAWAILQPLATMAAFAIFLGRVASSPDATVPYPLFVFAGLLPWTFFSGAVSSASTSVIGNERLVTKVYFPRLLVPLSTVLAATADFAIASALFLVLMPFFGFLPGWSMLAAPVIVLLIILVASSLGVLLAALTVAYRDFRYVVPFTLQLWMFATPTVFLQNLDVLGPRMRPLLLLNPVHGLVVNFRAAVLGGAFDFPALAVSTLCGVLLFAAGSLYFRRVERGFADII
jgi:lipopolysaccharide transport system permease protein